MAQREDTFAHEGIHLTKGEAVFKFWDSNTFAYYHHEKYDKDADKLLGRALN